MAFLDYQGLSHFLDKLKTIFILTDKRGAVNGVAELDATGKVPVTQLPALVNDVIEGYYYNGYFYEDVAHTAVITGETGKIYVDLSTDKEYRWDSNSYIELCEITSSNVTDALGYTPKSTQSAVIDPTASGTSLTFIDSISQDAQGVITPTKKSVSTFVGATQPGSYQTFVPGVEGLVPAPTQSTMHILRSDGTWGYYPISATTSDKGIVQLSDTINDTSTSNAATASLARRLAVYTVTKTAVSSLPTTITDSDIFSAQVVVGYHLSNPSAKKSTWTITTNNGSLTIDGTISGTTDISLSLGYQRN